MAASDKPKLYYFDATGRAEISRLIFVIAGVDFEDVRFSGEEWASKYKAEAPLGMAPYYEEGGVKLGGSLVIARYLGEKHGLGGANAVENAQLDSYADALGDLGTKLFGIKFGPEEKREESKAEFLKSGSAKLGFIEKQINGKDSFLDGKVSWADVMAYTLCEFIEISGVIDALKDCPKLKAITAKIDNNEKVKAHYAKHPPKQ